MAYKKTVESISSQGKDHHTFKYWSLSENGGAYNFDTKITENITLYAVYTANNYTATFNGNGGNNGTSITKAYNSELGTLPTSSRKYTITYDLNSTGCSRNKSSDTVSYTFDGWYTSSSGGSKISTTTKLTQNVTYYAHWTSASTTLAVFHTVHGILHVDQGNVQ